MVFTLVFILKCAHYCTTFGTRTVPIFFLDLATNSHLSLNTHFPWSMVLWECIFIVYFSVPNKVCAL